MAGFSLFPRRKTLADAIENFKAQNSRLMPADSEGQRGSERPLPQWLAENGPFPGPLGTDETGQTPEEEAPKPSLAEAMAAEKPPEQGLDLSPRKPIDVPNLGREPAVYPGPPAPTHLEDLQSQIGAIDHPSMKNRIIRAIIAAGGIGLGAAFGGTAGATGAAGAVNQNFEEEQQTGERRRMTLQQEMENELNRQERTQEREMMTSATTAGQRSESARAAATLAEQIRHNKAVEQQAHPDVVEDAYGNKMQYDPTRKTWVYVAPQGQPPTGTAKQIDLYTGEPGGPPMGITRTEGKIKKHVLDPSQMTPDEQRLFETAQNAFEEKSWKQVDPIIRAQIGERPRQQPGQSAADYEKTLATWGAKAQDLKTKMTTDPAVARAVAFGMNRPVQVYDVASGLTFYQTAGDAIRGGIPAAAGTKDIRPRTAIMNDMQASIEQLKDHTKVLDGGIVHRTLINTLLSSPDPTAAKDALVSRFAQQLTPEEENFVTMLLTAREQVFGLRKTLTGAGGGSDEQARQILNTLPGTRTPSSRMADKQIDQALAVLGRLRKTIPDIEGAPRPPNAPAGAVGLPTGKTTPQKTIRMSDASGALWDIPTNRRMEAEKNGMKVVR
jgi:hypothetical protein